MTRSVLLAVMVAACGHGDAAPTRVENHRMPSTRCALAIANPGGTLAMNGRSLPDLEPSRLRAVLGEPDRVERIAHRERYEEFGDGNHPSTSDNVEIQDVHYVYDRLGVVFSTGNGAWDRSETPTVVRVFFAHPRVFDHTAAPAVTPRTRGQCAVTINGVALDPDVDLRPAGVTYQTDPAPLFGTTFGFTSFATAIDRLYTDTGGRHIEIFLDAPATGRAAYLEVR